ncbi:MAG TPA: substrate-binding domain-containing protein [Pirellulales bacterium]|nr:substrate-binding domain-containing protein [Pirellulales bacterium]
MFSAHPTITIHACDVPHFMPRPGRGRCGERRGAASWPALAIISTLLLLGLLMASLFERPASPVAKQTEASTDKQPLMIYCAASNRDVMEAVRGDYEQEFGIPVQVQYGPSQTLLSSLEVSKSGDLYLPADDSFLARAHERDLIDDEFALADMKAVVAVGKGNPKKIAKLDDLLRDEIRVAQGSTEATAIGKVTKAALEENGEWEALKQHTTVFKTTVNDVANDVKIGAVDAGIVYGPVLHDYDTLEGIPIPELASIKSRVAVGLLKSSDRPKAAAHFARYLSARDKGLVRYAEFGFAPVEGDAWAEQPELTLYAGSMLRPAIEETIAEFERREGVKVTRVYNGCGILVAQMKAGEVPDAYFACDSEFMNQVKDIFPSSETVSQNELVILVKKGNPHGIKSLKDLSKAGLRVGIGHEKQCAMGWLTQRTFAESGLQTEVMKNVVVQTPTGDMLVNQMRSGSLDAAVVYLSNAAGAAEYLDAIRIQGIPCSIATQPYGVAKDSNHRQLGERLLRAIRTESSKEKFANEGFRWLEGPKSVDE